MGYNQRMSSQVVATLGDLAAGQWGMFTTAQAARVGIERMQLVRLANAGVLERAGHGVYALASVFDEHRDLHEAWLSLDPKATAEERIRSGIEAVVASHASAAALHGMGDLDPSFPELNTAARRQTSRRVKLHRLALEPDEVTLVDGLPTTTPERTILDLLRGRHDQTHVAAAIRDGLRAGIVDLEKLAVQLDRVSGLLEAPDGESLMLRLLDMVELSPAALVGTAARSPVGKEIAARARREFEDDLLAKLGAIAGGGTAEPALAGLILRPSGTLNATSLKAIQEAVGDQVALAALGDQLINRYLSGDEPVPSRYLEAGPKTPPRHEQRKVAGG